MEILVVLQEQVYITEPFNVLVALWQISLYYSSVTVTRMVASCFLQVNAKQRRFYCGVATKQTNP